MSNRIEEFKEYYDYVDSFFFYEEIFDMVKEIEIRLFNNLKLKIIRWYGKDYYYNLFW